MTDRERFQGLTFGVWDLCFRFVEWCRLPTQQNKFVLAHDQFGAQSLKAIKVWKVRKLSIASAR